MIGVTILIMKKILIIEDDIDTLDIIKYLLDDNNFETFCLKELVPLTEVLDIQPDIILIDYRLPNGPGSEFCFKLKNDPVFSSIPVILMSTHTQLKELAQESCADDYLAKPFDLDDVLAVLSKY